MTAIESGPSSTDRGARMPGAEGSGLPRRAALDLSVDEELMRGEVRGCALPAAMQSDLTVLVEHELTHPEPLLEKRFLAAGLRFGILSTGRRRRLEALVEMSLARREGAAVHATVAGIAAVHRPSAGDGLPPRELLRSLRLAEISGIAR